MEGQRISKVDLQRYVAIDRKMMKQQEHAASREKHDDMTTGAGGRLCDNITLVQSTDTSSSEAIDLDSNGRSETERQQSATAPSSTASHSVMHATSQDRTANNSHKTDKAYRGLRQSTIQIYNGR